MTKRHAQHRHDLILFCDIASSCLTLWKWQNCDGCTEAAISQTDQVWAVRLELHSFSYLNEVKRGTLW